MISWSDSIITFGISFFESETVNLCLGLESDLSGCEVLGLARLCASILFLCIVRD